MTVAEQLAQNNPSLRWQLAGRIFSLALALVVIAMALVLFKVGSKANTTANRVDTALGQSVVAICQSRVTTLGSAPQTVRDYRAIADAETDIAKRVCPGIDYVGLKARRQAELERLQSGVPPEVIARQRVQP